MFRAFRIFILLLILAGVAVGAWQAKARATEWRHPLRVAVYPVVGDGSDVASSYVERLRSASFQPIEQFLVREALRYGLKPRYGPLVEIRLAPRVESLPPAPPAGASAPEIAWWSLRLRYWAWRVGSLPDYAPHVRLFVVYHDPARRSVLPHSVGLEKGLIGVVNAFASRVMEGENNVVIAHELLHTLGATDKYDPRNNQPIYPDGYADPGANPLLPQSAAEIMAGRIALSETEAEIPAGLSEAVVGPKTAQEINWLR